MAGKTSDDSTAFVVSLGASCCAVVAATSCCLSWNDSWLDDVANESFEITGVKRLIPGLRNGSFFAGVGNLNADNLLLPPGDVRGDGNFGRGRTIGVRRGTGRFQGLSAVAAMGDDGGVNREIGFGRGGRKEELVGAETVLGAD